MTWRRRYKAREETLEEIISEILDSLKLLDEKIAEYLREAEHPERPTYWQFYREAKRSYLRSEQWRVLAKGYTADLRIATARKKNIESIEVTEENYDELVARIEAHNEVVRRELAGPSGLRETLDLINREESRLREIYAVARERGWRMPGRPPSAARRRFETFSELLSYLLRKLRYLKPVYEALIERFEQLILEIPEPPRPPKLFRVQAMFRVIRNKMLRPTARSTTPEVIAEIRVWYYTRARTEEDAETQFSGTDFENAIWRMVDTEYYDERKVDPYTGKLGRWLPVFESLFNARHHEDGELIELDEKVKRETEEIDEDEMVYDVGVGAQEDTLYQAYTFYKTAGKTKQVYDKYDQRWIDKLLRHEVYSEFTPKKTVIEKAREEEVKARKAEERRRREAEQIKLFEATLFDLLREQVLQVPTVSTEVENELLSFIERGQISESFAKLLQRIARYQEKPLRIEDIKFYVANPNQAYRNEQEFKLRWEAKRQQRKPRGFRPTTTRAGEEE